MAVSNYDRLHTFIAAKDLSKDAGKAVCVTTGGKVTTNHTEGGAVLGILVLGGPADTEVGVCTELGSKVRARASAAITAGSAVMVGTDGRIATLAGTGKIGIGYALEAATNADEMITIVLTPAGVGA